MDKTAKKNIWYLAASAAVSCGVFVYLFTVVSPAEIVDSIRNAAPAGIIAYMVVGLASTVLRNVRYLILLRASETDIPISGGQMFLVTLVRNLFSDLLPARVGSLIYVVILNARFGFPVEIGTSVWAVAFVLDLVVMVPLIALGVMVVGADRLGISIGMLAAVASLFFIATVAALSYLPQIVSRAGRFVARIAPMWRKGALIKEKLELTGVEIRAIYHKGILARVIVLSFLVRILKYGCIAFLVYAILSPIDPDRYTLRAIGYWPVFLGASLAELSASTPLSGIGGFGLYEGIWTGTFYLLGYPRELAALSGVSAHVITQIFGYSLGVLGIVVLIAPLLWRGKRH
jgi:uncharacterized membrane protein YbhN (UPF0104 family)